MAETKTKITPEKAPCIVLAIIKIETLSENAHKKVPKQNPNKLNTNICLRPI